LRNDLAANPTVCTLAYWHEPRYSSGAEHGSSTKSQVVWTDLYNAGAEIVLSGHDHDYERFAPMNASSVKDTQYGVREFVVGTGGKNHYHAGTIEVNSEVRNFDTFGVIKLTLNPTGYTWEFIPVAGQTFTDSGSGSCHGAPPSAQGSSTVLGTTTSSAPVLQEFEAYLRDWRVVMIVLSTGVVAVAVRRSGLVGKARS
jgi:hypothetical protein